MFPNSTPMRHETKATERDTKAQHNQIESKQLAWKLHEKHRSQQDPTDPNDS